MTFITDLDDLIRHRHGDVKKLREIVMRELKRQYEERTLEESQYIKVVVVVVVLFGINYEI